MVPQQTQQLKRTSLKTNRASVAQINDLCEILKHLDGLGLVANQRTNWLLRVTSKSVERKVDTQMPHGMWSESAAGVCFGFRGRQGNRQRNRFLQR
mmetsp:Transcript_15064/g.17376  ORF Transcript_15064/g.17376 Transcript_15064/m.17376 type:complete len:96 (+) Transcript_15064:218-505(+)